MSNSLSKEGELEERDDKIVCLCFIIAGVAVALAAIPFAGLDAAVLEYFENFSSDTWEPIVKLLTQFGTGVVLGAIALFAFAVMRDRRAATRLALSLLIATIAVTILKNLISRQRPTSTTLESFPSGHSASVFAVAGAMAIYLRARGAPFLVAAAAVAFSRVFRSNHYLTDVIVGSGLGMACAGAAGLIVKRVPRFTRILWVRIVAGFLAFGFATVPWIKEKFTLRLSVLIALPPILLVAMWYYMPVIIAWLRRRVDSLTDRRLLLVMFGVCLFVFIMGSWASTLFDRDEGWYAETSREMLSSGDYLVPHYNGKPWLEKPPLTYWLMAGSMRVFGTNAFAARLPSVLAGAASCVVLFLLARSMLGRRTALASVAVYATSFISLLVFRVALTDGILLPLILVSLYGFWLIYRGGTSRLPWLMLYGGAGLAFLTKYMAGVAVVGMTALATIVLTRRWDVFRKARLPTGIPLFLAVACAWFVPAWFATEGEVLRVFYEQNIGRSTGVMHGHGGPFFYYIVMLPVIFLPWFLFLPQAFKRGDSELAPKSERWWFLVSWAVSTFVLFSAVSTKLPSYVFPAIPALAILVGSLLADPQARGEALAGWRRTFALVYMGVLGFGMPLAAVVGLESMKFYQLWRYFAPACILAIVASVLAILDLRRRDALRAAVTLAWGMVGAILLFTLEAAPSLDLKKLPAQIGHIVAEKSQPGDAVLHWRYVEPSLVFYARREVTKVGSRQELDRLIGASGRAFCILPPEEADALKRRMAGKATIKRLFEREGFNFARGKWQRYRLILVEKAPARHGSR